MALYKWLLIQALTGILVLEPAAASGSVGPSAGEQFPDAYKVSNTDSDALKPYMPDSISSSIPDNATLVARDIAATDNGEVKDVRTGMAVTDKEVIGTRQTPPDPMVKTGGKRFIPVQVGEARKVLAGSNGTSDLGWEESGSTNSSDQVPPGPFMSGDHDDSRAATPYMVRSATLQPNGYGAHWGSYNGTRAFFESNGNLFAQQAKGVIDVSQYQGDIDWGTAKNSGVEGAIIRIGYGWNNGYDYKALRNISECKRLGIPFGIYLYSYSYDNSSAAAEGDSLVDLLRRAGVSPADLTYPVYYDLEHWVWTGHNPPTSPLVYDGMVNTWCRRLRSAGYNNLSLYSYTCYLNTTLNTEGLHAKTHWVASYGGRTGFNFRTNRRCWQYSDVGRINGIRGDVDLDACGNYNYEGNSSINLSESERITNLKEGVYFIGSAFTDRYLDIEGASFADSARLLTWIPTDADNQLYHVVPVGQGLYTITSKKSGKTLDASGSSLANGTPIIQFAPNAGLNQRWSFYKAPNGYIYIASALGDMRSSVLDVTKANTDPGACLELWTPNGGLNQQFRLMQKIDSSLDRISIATAMGADYRIDIPKSSPYPEAPVEMWLPNNGDNQRFRFHDTGNGQYAISVNHSGQFLDIQYGYQGDGGKMIQYPWNGGANQLWFLQKIGDTAYAIRSLSSNKAIDVSDANPALGAKLITYTYSGQNNQRWRIG